MQLYQRVVVEIVGKPKERLKDGDPIVTIKKLLKSKCNIDNPEDGMWREDLYHNMLKIS